MEKDEIFALAESYVADTGTSVFLTGKAGTGKTTFLKYISGHCGKRHIILAPTGVAAINAGGATIHSFFQLPLCPYLPDIPELVNEYSAPEKYHSLRKERIKLIRSLELLIIDEISMVRADLLDAIDMCLRRYRRSGQPFGGVQLLMIGDIQQLSPVVKEEERALVSRVYPSPYFFESKALKQLPFVTIELQKVHRQSDAEFIEILNAIREKRVTPQILSRLNSRTGAAVGDGQNEPIRLMTHVGQAAQFNAKMLDALDGEAVRFDAEVTGEFPESMYPTEESVSLKVGTQVMFIRNDSDGAYYNGKIGTVRSILPEGTVVVRTEEGADIPVDAVEWPNTRYSLDEETGEILQETVGTFKQIPLRLAWAITIHKSQGLTFDRVIIDAGAAFSFGQVYVALSRCRSLQGISLERPISAAVLFGDEAVEMFERQVGAQPSASERLERERKKYFFDCARSVFDFCEICKGLYVLKRLWRQYMLKLYSKEADTISADIDKMEEAESVGGKFMAQLSSIEKSATASEDYLKERMLKAAGYFGPTLEVLREDLQHIFTRDTDNTEARKRLRQTGEDLISATEFHCRALKMITEQGFSVGAYNKIKTELSLEESPLSKRKKDVPVNDLAVNEELRQRIQDWRSAKFKELGIPAYQVLHQSVVLAIAALAPQTAYELISIKGFSNKLYEKFGEEILAICREFPKKK